MKVCTMPPYAQQSCHMLLSRLSRVHFTIRLIDNGTNSQKLVDED